MNRNLVNFLLVSMTFGLLVLISCTPKASSVSSGVSSNNNNSKDNNNNDNQSTEAGNYVSNQVLVLLQEHIEPQVLEGTCSQYKLKAVSIASRSQNLWLYSFDDSTIDYKNICKELRKSKQVLSADPVEITSEIKVTSGKSGKAKKVNIKSGH